MSSVDRYLVYLDAEPFVPLLLASYWCLVLKLQLVSVAHSPLLVPPPRGVQYVHWVMHKCIMVKVGGKRNTRKVCKKPVNLSKTGGKFIKVGRK